MAILIERPFLVGSLSDVKNLICGVLGFCILPHIMEKIKRMGDHFSYANLFSDCRYFNTDSKYLIFLLWDIIWLISSAFTPFWFTKWN